MSTEADLLGAFEVHSPEGIQSILDSGISPRALIGGKRPIDCLIEGYLRSARFADCIRVMLRAGAIVGDPLIEALLLDDADALKTQIESDPATVTRRLTLLAAFTSCRGVTALHLCAEFNSIECAKLLIHSGADVDAQSLVDQDGFGGQTPVFHTVNSILNYCRPMMELLVGAGASLHVRVPLVLWGETMPWETVVFDSTPVSYAQCGLFRQFHRAECDIYDNIAFMLSASTGSVPPRRNVPNQYLSE